MLDNKDIIIKSLIKLGLGFEETKIYLELLREPSTHLRLSQATGINRTKVYRLADELEKKSLITKRTDDRGTFLVATDPMTLEVELTTKEEKLKSQRAIFEQLIPKLELLKTPSKNRFIINTYEGKQGFKQMLWHELKAEKEALIFGSGTIEDLVPERRWAENHRAQTVEAKYKIREILNPGDKQHPFTLNSSFMDRYTHRIIPRELLPLANQIVIYNDTVSIYHWREQQKVGVEILNSGYNRMMRALFENYWSLAQPPD